MDGIFENKVVLVTGAGSGIGAATARHFGAEGAKVILADKKQEAAEEIAATIEQALAVRTDVTDAEACLSLIDIINQKFGRLDVAVNNAGITEVSALNGADIPETHNLPLDVWRKVLSTNLDGIFHCLRAELPLMLKTGGGAILNMASLQSHIGYPRTVAYTTAKHGILGITRTTAKEYGGRGIRCNAISPGVVDTPLTTNFIHQPQHENALLASIPLGRFATPDDIAQAAIWLCSAEAEYINGAVLVADGGYLA